MDPRLQMVGGPPRHPGPSLQRPPAPQHFFPDNDSHLAMRPPSSQASPVSPGPRMPNGRTSCCPTRASCSAASTSQAESPQVSFPAVSVSASRRNWRWTADFSLPRTIPSSTTDGRVCRGPKARPGGLYEDWRRKHWDCLHRNGEDQFEKGGSEKDGS